MKWDEDGFTIRCFCGWRYDARGLTTERIAMEMHEHCAAHPTDHTWNVPARAKFIGEVNGMFVDETGELWRHTRVGWEWVCVPRPHNEP